jgi:IS5 family transposase
MRVPFHPQLVLSLGATVRHAHAQELIEMSELLDVCAGDILPRVLEEMSGGKGADIGRAGMTAEQAVRIMVIKQMHGLSYEELAFHLEDSVSFRWFCRLNINSATPSKSALQDNLKRITAETWQALNKTVIGHAAREGIEKGRKVRFDTTVTETNIHEPSDSSLLYDTVRTLTRMVKKNASRTLPFVDHRRRAKRRALEILNAKNNRDRKGAYSDLIRITASTLAQAEALVAHYAEDTPRGARFRRYIALGKKVVGQTRRRVLFEERVPSSEKIVSIFEEHTDIIVKDRRQTLYGHKISLASGASNLILDLVIHSGNPADSALTTDLVKRHIQTYGKAPRQTAFDGGFASRDNLEKVKALGVKDVSFSKGRGLGVTEMVKSAWVYKNLRNFRAGIEGTISFVKRCFGLTRCTWRTSNSFKAYCWGSVLSCNLLVMARYSLAVAPA